MMSGGNLQDEMLRAYIDKVFEEFDEDKNGSLDQTEMTHFFNTLFQKLGMNHSVTPEEALSAVKSIDQNFDGAISKPELFTAFKQMLNKTQKMQPM
jgi:Ca2+-binding EF-hand superfamily protein